MESRQSWRDFFFDLADMWAKRSTCIKRSVGAIIVSPIDKRVLAAGFNGAPAKTKHCTKDNCLRKDIPSGEQLDRCRAVHAEENCLLQAAKYGIKVEGMVMYCTTKPCNNCIKSLINAGISTVYYKIDYNSELTDELMKEPNVGLELVRVK